MLLPVGRLAARQKTVVLEIFVQLDRHGTFDDLRHVRQIGNWSEICHVCRVEALLLEQRPNDSVLLRSRQSALAQSGVDRLRNKRQQEVDDFTYEERRYRVKRAGLAGRLHDDSANLRLYARPKHSHRRRRRRCHGRTSLLGRHDVLDLTTEERCKTVGGVTRGASDIAVTSEH